VVDDDSQFGQKCCQRLFDQGFDAKYCSNSEQARTFLSGARVDIILIDLMLPPTYTSEGLDLLKLVRSRYPGTAALMITQKESAVTETVAEAMLAGAEYFLDKHSPVLFDKLQMLTREIMNKQIFLSHGHNELLKLKLKDFLQNSLGQKPVILADQPSRGLTIVEKLERVSEECWFAVILMTKDDEQNDGGVRARQNVVHEIGFFQGKYGRKNVVLLAEHGVEVFSNISGIVRIEFEPNHFSEAFEDLRREIEAALPPSSAN
jgi:DNA-binding NarL/FixJ family response regulator